MTDAVAAGLAVHVDRSLEPFRHLDDPGAASPTGAPSAATGEAATLGRYEAFLSETCGPV